MDVIVVNLEAFAPERYYTNSYNWHPGAKHSSKKHAIPEIFEVVQCVYRSSRVGCFSHFVARSI